ncbi:MAG TPA: tol-pal system protein YbgF [Stellaceae bacterium]|jgi:tol-pal system protein YbgF|nr:tol-pal system protein YbgF [Stellaceae bacterium]
MARSALFFPAAAVVLFAVLALQPARAQSGFQTDQRIDALQDQMRQMTGRIEELNNEVIQLKAQLDRQASDNDVRFQQLQGGGGALNTAPPQPNQFGPGSGSPSAQLPPQPRPPLGAGADPSQPPSRSGNLGTLSSGRQPPPPDEPPPQQQAAAGGALPSGNAQDQYNYAMGLLTQANYPAAEQAMRAFVQKYPKDPLAGNAQYWLGETFYVRKDYGNAATAFAQGYEKYPKGPKAADDLLKLGMSLTALNQKADACRSFARLAHDFPSPPQSIKDRLTAERQRAGCSG